MMTILMMMIITKYFDDDDYNDDDSDIEFPWLWLLPGTATAQPGQDAYLYAAVAKAYRQQQRSAAPPVIRSEGPVQDHLDDTLEREDNTSGHTSHRAAPPKVRALLPFYTNTIPRSVSCTSCVDS
jgi:hypothetical protein